MKTTRMERILALLVLTGLLLAACQAATPTQTSPPTAAPTEPPVAEYGWWNDAVFYEVFVRSFYDSDGDGIGDINGLSAKLDYLNDGDPDTADDHGYDVVDYYQVDDEDGTRAPADTTKAIFGTKCPT